MKTYKTKASVAILPLLVAIALVSGCGKKDDAAKSEGKEKAATQVAAKVNAEEITVHQVNSVLSRNPNIPPEAAAKAKQNNTPKEQQQSDDVAHPF